MSPPSSESNKPSKVPRKSRWKVKFLPNRMESTNEMGKSRSMHGVKRMVEIFRWECQKERDH
jgi:hypothetical protein